MTEAPGERRAPSPTTRLALAVVGALVLVAVVVGGILWARDEDPPSSYDSQIEDDFMATCTADAETAGFAHPDEFCRCAFDAIREQVAFDRFLEIDAALRADPQQVPPVIDRIRNRCFVAVEGPGQAPPS